MAPPLDCPGCDEGALVAHRVEGVSLDRCDRCGGLWFDPRELDDLRRALGAVRPRALREKDLVRRSGVVAGACPRGCSGEFVLGELQRIDFRHCTVCRGLFLDADAVIRLLEADRLPPRSSGGPRWWDYAEAGGEVVWGLFEFLGDVFD